VKLPALDTQTFLQKAFAYVARGVGTHPVNQDGLLQVVVEATQDDNGICLFEGPSIVLTVSFEFDRPLDEFGNRKVRLMFRVAAIGEETGRLGPEKIVLGRRLDGLNRSKMPGSPRGPSVPCIDSYPTPSPVLLLRG
jgi:hypothetical protein